MKYLVTLNATKRFDLDRHTTAKITKKRQAEFQVVEKEINMKRIFKQAPLHEKGQICQAKDEH